MRRVLRSVPLWGQWLLGGVVAGTAVALVARWRRGALPAPTSNVPGGVAARANTILPGTHETLWDLLSAHLRPGQKASALMGMIVNESSPRYAGGVLDITRGGNAFEAGLFQFPSGSHGAVTGAPVTGQGDDVTRYKMPAAGVSTRDYPPNFWTSTMGELLRQLGHTDATDWRDPYFQVQAGPLMLEQDFAHVRAEFDDLYRDVGSDWWTRSELFTFSGGGAALGNALRAQHAALGNAPEAARWEMLRAGGMSPRWMQQVDAYLNAAREVGYPSR